jgi:integrase
MQIDRRGKRLVIRWKFEGKPYSLSFAGCNTPIGLLMVEGVANRIKLDIASGNFDRTKLKYAPQKLGKNPTAITAIELFEKYIHYQEKEGTIQHGSIKRLKTIASKLEKFIGDVPAQKLTETIAKNTIAQWSESANNHTIKTYLYFLKACWDWAKGKYHVPDINPWESSLERSRSRKNPPPQKTDTPFTLNELGVIIAAFNRHPSFCHYTDFVSFLAGTACRFGEAVALRWENLGVNYSTVWIGSSISRGVANNKGTKTGTSRLVRLSPSLQAMLKERFDRLNPQPTDLVFPSPTGIPINDRRFRARAWAEILESCQIEYQTPYKLRHAVISHALANSANPVDLSEQTGHSVRVMLSTYAHAIEQKCLFVDF